MSITPLSKDQWKKVLTALVFSFISTFLGTFMSAGGIQSTQEATITLVLSSLVSAINGTLYGVWKLFEDDSQR